MAFMQILDTPFIKVLPDIERRMSFLPFVIFGALLITYIDILLLYLLFKIFNGKKVLIKDVFYEFAVKYIITELICHVIFVVLSKITDNQIILDIPQVILALAMCYFSNNYLKKFDISLVKKYIIFIIIFACTVLI